MTPPNSSIQLTLFQAENDANRYIQYTMVEQANALARALAKKNLPMFYFTEAGKELNIPAKTCRSWKINTWPTVNRPSDDKLIHKVAIYIRVYLRLSDYPEQETYLQATNRLQRRILEIKEKTFSHNRISQHLRISFRTLNDIIEKKPEEAIRRNHCPWALLTKLDGAETEMQEKQEKQEELQENRILQESKKYKKNRMSPEPPDNRNLLQKDGSCPKCGAAPHNLRYDGKDTWDRTIMVCIICGSENPTDVEETAKEVPKETPEEATEEALDDINEERPNRKEFVNRYEPCRECGTPWHNLKRDRVDRWKNTVYICLRCAGVNRVKRQPRPARIT